MKRDELITEIAHTAGITRRQAKVALNTLLTLTKNSLCMEGKMVLTGFGTFRVVERAAREGRNPQTGRPVKIPATKVVRFKPAKGLKSL